MWETRIQYLGWEDFLEKEMVTHSSILAWKIPRMEEPGRLQSMGSQRVGHDWATSLSLSISNEWKDFATLSIWFWSKNEVRDVDLAIQLQSQFSCSVVSDSLWPHGLQHSRLPCPSSILEPTQTHIHCVGDAIQPSHPLSSPSLPTFNLSQQQELFQWVGSSYQVAKVLEFQLHHQFSQWIFRTDFL